MNVPTISQLSVRGLAWMIGAAITLAVAWLSWLTAAQWTTNREIDQRPTREQTERLITVSSPYIADRNLILQQMTDRAEADQRLLESMDKQTDSIRRIETELAKFSTLLRQTLTHNPEDF